MLRGFRKASQGLVGKIIVGVMFSFLIVSFAIWGINDIFRGGVRNTVATVGKTEITAESVRNAYQNEIQRLSRQTRRNLTPEQARSIGLDAQVLSRLVTEAALDQKAADLGLNISDQLVARMIIEDPNFRGANGQFDRAAFNDLLRSAGLTEAAYVREQRAVVARMQFVDAISAGLPVPGAAREAIHRYGAERRAVAYLVLPAGAAGDIPAPTEDELKTFFESRKTGFRAPEYRALNVLALDVEGLAKPDAVSDADARQRYEQLKASRFGTPERRAIQQIEFASPEEAEAAFQRIKSGATFEAVAEEKGKKDVNLGTFAKTDMLDKAVAEAAFALEQGAVSGPVKGQFGTVLVRATAVERETQKGFEAVADEVRREIALERARGEVNAVHDAIEDMRAGARPLVEIARDKNLPLVQIPAIDRAGRDKTGKPVETLPDRDAVLNAAFTSDVGVDNEPLRTRAGGYVWFDVTGIEPARDKPLAEVRDAVAAQWRDDQVAQKLSERSRALTERLDKGETVEAIAPELGLEAKNAADLGRNAPKEDLPPEVVNRVFATPVGKAASAPLGEASRVVFRVVSANVPPLAAGAPQPAAVDEQLRLLFSDDLLTELIAQVQSKVGVSINQAALKRAIGGEL